MRLLPLLTQLHTKSRSLHLPAHGRGLALPKDLIALLKKKPGLWDLPELNEIGGPTEKNGIIAESQSFVANAMGVKNAWYGVNGATGLLQVGLLSMTKPGGKVLMPRNTHKSLIHACVLGNLSPVLFDIPFLPDRGHYSPPDLNWLEQVLEQLTKDDIQIDAAVLIHPTYHGYAKDLNPLVKLLQKKGVPVLVDEAHGSYLAGNIDNDLPASSLGSGADLVVHSLHKSACGLNQTAVLWLQGNKINPNQIEKNLECLQTTSPSALLMASCDSAIRELLSAKALKNLQQRLYEARIIYSQLIERGVPLLTTQDPLRLILHTAPHGINGLIADGWFIEHGLVAELPEPGCITFCLGMVRHKGLSNFISRKWFQLLDSVGPTNPLGPFECPPNGLLTIPSISPTKAWFSKKQKVKLKEAIGRISAELICPYPPGIPLVIPGMYLDMNLVHWLLKQRLFWSNQISDEISVVCREETLI
ncbi:aminotransferase class I/II-fold pyridoxal phosphate-dependent enzyme [Prochlorococcus sp. MIT 1341]|uniref:aminotransferase class I/II-fold pyridoxal phosphate-dependent enzyme n=1 Tax=Prochlorococcus sp. MIT 1341 TaxID=3096221 RepID=UPI002A750B66|nr:aminotransferase class I/II-fold pyridoxal phosphate-dependent enzyme [Prochlorococcus sp. MIT 1341]